MIAHLDNEEGIGFLLCLDGMFALAVVEYAVGRILLVRTPPENDVN